MDCAENEYVAEIEQCLPIYKKEKSNLSMTDWPCHAWLQKKKVPPTNKATLGVCYQRLCIDLSDGILCTLSPKHNLYMGE